MPSRRHLAKLGLAHGNIARSHEHAHAYPRPMLRRKDWTSLDGPWEFALDPEATHHDARTVIFDATIEVPFSVETERSGIGNTGLYKACWYRRTVDLDELVNGERLILNFGAVDYEATVWFDGTLAARHEGGYTPFAIDVTRLMAKGRTHEIVVRAEDDPSDLAKPRGKQDWQLEPHSIWYPRTTGIWQTVWLERVGSARVAELKWTPNMVRWEIGMDGTIVGPAEKRYWLTLRLSGGDVLLAEDRYSVVAGEVHRTVALSDPGIDDFRNELLWSPSRPTLIEAELQLVDENGAVVDAVSSYTALRSFGIEGTRFVLNGRPYPLRMVLDQGYWPETGLTAPDDDALRRDVELTKAMGFNGARKHQKVEDPRYLYWADRLGLLVWAEMPSAYRFTRQTIERLTRQWMEVIKRDVSHPCIVAWVPLNESWGVPNLPESQTERHLVESLYHLTKTLDPTRPVVGNDGWESVATDILGIHDYDANPERIAQRYATVDLLPKILKHERPGGRALVVGGRRRSDQSHPVVLSEFGGIALADGAETWGYSVSRNEGELAERYATLLGTVRSLQLLAGFCYTQLADTYQEANGLLRADRTPKFSLRMMAEATSGRVAPAAGDEKVDVVPPQSLAEIAITERGGAPR
ncbi:MAG: Beta-galactosidase [Labilithrix sp.]|nr:Beta-galactosidase [Labilithrix sp.]